MFPNLFFICEKSEKENYFFLLIETELGFNFAKTSHVLLIIYLFNSRVLTDRKKLRNTLEKVLTRPSGLLRVTVAKPNVR